MDDMTTDAGNSPGPPLPNADRVQPEAISSVRESEKHYRSLFENMLNGSAYCRMLFDQDKPTDFIYLNVNGAFKALTGLKDVVGKKVSEVIPGIQESDPELFETYGRVALTGKPERFETYVRALDIWFSVSVYSPRKEYFVAVFEGITDRKRAEEALRESEKAAQQLAEENAVMSEIGRIISSSLKIEEVYERFAAEAHKLIAFDRIMVGLNNPDRATATVTYVWGTEVEGRRIGDQYSIADTSHEEVTRTGVGLLVQLEALDDLKGRFYRLVPTFQAGLRSILAAPLISRDQVIGVVHLRSKKIKAYTDRDLRLAERIGAQIAGAIANAQLFLERERAQEALRKSEKAAQRLAQENALVAEIGRIIGSSLNINEVYERFAEETRKLIRFDRVSVNIINPIEKTFSIPYTTGTNVLERESGDVIHLAGTGTEWVRQNRSTLLIGEANREETMGKFPGLLPVFEAGIRSMMLVPMISEDQVIGVLNLQSATENAYTQMDLKLAERVSSQIAGAIANAQLFQERKRVEGELLKSEERYRRLVELSPLMIMVHNQKKYIYLNPAAAKALGASRPEELVGRSILEVIHPACWGIVNERIRLVAQGKAVPPLEEKFIRLDKKIIDVEVTVARSLYLGEPVVMLIGRDITEQREAEKEKAALQERLQQAQKMEAIGTLAGGIAHDFNNILSSILGFGELADLDMPENTRAKSNLQHSMKAALRAKDLVQQILAFSRQGKQERKPLNIKPIIKEGLKFLRASLPATIEIRQNIDEDLGTIEADPTQIHQVLMNLCTNAAHAMDGNGGVLEVSLGNLDVEGETSISSLGIHPGPYLRLRVTDTGHGIPPETLKRIFDPYFTTKEVGKGTGLGLAVVHGIVKSYGGGIALSSKVGKGSTFDIYFPRIGTESSPLETGEGEPIPLGKHERVLFVDDEEMIVEIGQNFLEHLGYEAVARTSSVEALELFRVQPARFDLVITDMTMPKMTGDKLAQELLRIRPEIPIIIYTGFSEHITEEKAKAMGIRGFVKKPLVMKELAKAVRSALDSHKDK